MNKKNKIQIGIIIFAEIFLTLTCIYDFITIRNIIYHIDNEFPVKLIGLILKITVIGIMTSLALVFWLKNKINDLKRKNQQLDALTANVPGSVISCSCNSDLIIYDYSETFTELTGYSKEELEINFDNKFIKMVFPMDRERLLDTISKNLNAYESEYRMLTKSGKMIWIFEKGKMINEKGVKKYYSVLVDVTDAKRAQREIEETKKELEISNERYRIVMEQSDSIIFEFDIQKKQIYFSGRFFDKFGYYVADHNFPASFVNDKLVHPDDEEKFIIFYNKILDGVHFVNDEHRILSVVNGNREYIWCNVKATTILDKNGKPIKAIGRLKDVSKRKAEKTRQIGYEHTDELTGLLNRETFEIFSDTAIADNKDLNYAVMIIDIKDFKYFNDEFGYTCADKILSDFALKLEKMFRFSDIIARINGDVFAVFLKSPTEDIIMKKITEINDSLKTLTPENSKIELSCFIGIALYPADAKSAEDLYYNAESAIQYVKNRGKENYAFYSNATEIELNV